MKKIFLMWISVSLSTYFLQAQQMTHTMMAVVDRVSEQSKATFYEYFGNVPDVQWQRQDLFDLATFTKDGQKTNAYFDNDGKLVGTSVQTNLKALPMKSRLEIAKKYGDYNVEDVILYDDNNEQISDIILYGTQMESADNYFVELRKNDKKIILEVTPEGNVSFFKELKH